ncbi:hypothetical protein B0H13DRAFT_1898515 [Mycena leptocephala]|nr:hypothetical protein B0H13DRAFT_1898515 [Mycena leptocephala]
MSRTSLSMCIEWPDMKRRNPEDPGSCLTSSMIISPTKAESRQKSTIPPWCSWGIDNIKIDRNFFDEENKRGYLPNWKAVVEWMEGSPHLPADHSGLSHAQAFDILLIVGLTHRAAKECANSDPDSPLYEIPFEIADLEKIESAIKNMLAQAKSFLKFGVSPSIHRSIESSWKKVCLEVGLATSDVKTFGEDWKVFVETYVAVDSALLRSGKPPQLHATDLFPEVLQSWSRAAESLLASKDKRQLEVWSTMLTEMTATLKLITEAQSIKRPESRRGYSPGSLILLQLIALLARCWVQLRLLKASINLRGWWCRSLHINMKKNQILDTRYIKPKFGHFQKKFAVWA